MKKFSALFLLSITTNLLSAAPSCNKLISCPCGQTGKNYTFCLENSEVKENFCNKIVGCKTCRDGLFQCLECEAGFEGPECSKILKTENYRQKQQVSHYPSERHRRSRKFKSPKPIYRQASNSECGISVIQSEESKTGIPSSDTKTMSSEWPWTVAISKRKAALDIVCTGALINTRTVLTAAHCVDDSSFTLYFGKTQWKDKNLDDKDSDVRQSTKVIRHQDYSNSTFENDIALIKFDPPVSFTSNIQPICLPSKEITTKNNRMGRTAIVTTWGIQQYIVPHHELKNFKLPVLTNEECIEAYKKLNITLPLKENMFCTSFGENPVRTCVGDNGSPIVFRNMDTGRFSVEGLPSSRVSDQCGLEGKYPVFTKVGWFITWILENENEEQVKDCNDPGFVVNGYRKNQDGSHSNLTRTFTRGETVTFNCFHPYNLRGSSSVQCVDGKWSNSLPQCLRYVTISHRSCPDPGFIENGSRMNIDGSDENQQRNFEHGESLIFDCDELYYTFVGSRILDCTDGKWSSTLPHCCTNEKIAICTDPGKVLDSSVITVLPKNAACHPTAEFEYLEGTHLIHSCKNGLVLLGHSNITCGSDGQWSTDPPSCTIASGGVCPDPGFIENGSRMNADGSDETQQRNFGHGESLIFDCIQNGYSFVGSHILDCKDGKWSHPLPHCRTNEVPLSSAVRLVTKNPVTESLLQIDCVADGPPGTEVSWQFNEMDLDLGYDPLKVILRNHTLVITRAQLSDIGEYRCIARNNNNVAVSSVYVDIRANHRPCPDPGFIENGSRMNTDGSDEKQQRNFEDGESLLFDCSGFDYNFVGERILDCKDGKWSHPLPHCFSNKEKAVCPDPGNILYGSVTAVTPKFRPQARKDYDYPEGTRLIYTCEKESVLLGNSNITCEHSGDWSADPPVCSIDCGTSIIQTEKFLSDEGEEVPTNRTEEFLSERLFKDSQAIPGEWPWVVAIAVRNDFSSYIICSGALINSRTVLTAAHCVVGKNLTLYFGKTHRWDKNDDSEVEVRQSTEVIRHPKYSRITHDNDIALIHFNPRVRFTDRIQPVCLPTTESMARHIKTGQKGVVTLWEDNLPDVQLKKVRLPVITNEECAESYSKHSINIHLTKNMFCTEFEEDQKTNCTRDGGSPMVFKNLSTGRYSVEGLVSFGAKEQCGEKGLNPVFTKVGQYASWIRRNGGGSTHARWRGV